MIPIVFIHQFNHGYLPISFWKARETNPESEIYLLGDAWNAHFGTILHHRFASRYAKKAEELAKIFVNFSSNPPEFELICLQRWFILLSFMEEMGWEKCLYMDSDVLLFSNATTHAARFSDVGMTVAGISGHTNFIQNREILSQFCHWILDAYSNPQKIKEAEEKYRIFCQTHEAGGLSDMTYFSEFREKFPEAIADISEIKDGKSFDITITYTNNWQSEDGIKKINWLGEKPFAISVSGENVEMCTLHFQGDSKKHMLELARIKNPGFQTLYLLNNAYIFLQKGLRKIFRQ